MLRRWYLRLLRLHPRHFRERFAEEMLWIFDLAATPGERAALVADGAVSAVRQRCFRVDAPEAPAAAASSGGDARVPLFYSAPADGPRPAALAEGAVVALLVMGAMLFLMGRGGQRIHFSIGSRTPRTGLLEVATREGPSTLSAEVGVKAPREKPTRGRLFDYFHLLPVLTAIDTDQDLEISAEEMRAAPARLRALDRDGDGRLSPEECGFGDSTRGANAADLFEEMMAFDRNHDGKLEARELPDRLRAVLARAGRGADGKVSGEELRRLLEREAALRKGAAVDPAFVRKTRAWFMRVHPVLAALDTDRDGVLSPVEIATAGAALQALDWNHDDVLTAEEVLPDPVINALAIYFVRADADGDGRISKAEAAVLPKQMRYVVAAAALKAGDAPGEGDLRNELRRRAIGDNDGGAHQLEIAGEANSPRR